jgi:flagellar biosynthetic protein FliQ
MEHAAVHMLSRALETALMLCVPIVAAVAATGVVVGVAQTIVQVQDQNVAFLPKLIVVALVLTVGGAAGLALLIDLFNAVAASALKLIGH